MNESETADNPHTTIENSALNLIEHIGKYK